jgi:MFS family permease
VAVVGGSSLSAAVLRRVSPQRAVAAGLGLIAVADLALVPAARSAWGVPACAAAAGLGIGLSSVAATGLGTDVRAQWRGGAAGIINTAAQVGTAVGVAVLLLIAAAATGGPAAGRPAPDVAWITAAVAAGLGAAWFTLQSVRMDRHGPADDGVNTAGPGRARAGGVSRGRVRRGRTGSGRPARPAANREPG